MKKAYVKPGMYVENFTLSQSVAAGGCGAAQDSTLGKPGLADRNACGWDMGNAIIWTLGEANCDFPGADEYEGVCYNNPGPGNAIFSLS